MARFLPSSPNRLDDNIALWAEFEETAQKYNAIGLGTGLPSYRPPIYLRDFMLQAFNEGAN